VRVIDAVATRLVSEGVGTKGVTIFAGGDVYLPSAGSPALLSLTETGGAPPDRVHNAKAIRHPTAQVVARAGKYPDAAALIDRAYNALGGDEDNRVVNLTIEGIFFLDIHPTSEVLQLPVDAQGRVRLAFNIAMTRR
jgi:hypothetical protein